MRGRRDARRRVSIRPRSKTQSLDGVAVKQQRATVSARLEFLGAIRAIARADERKVRFGLFRVAGECRFRTNGEQQKAAADAEEERLN